MENNITLKNKGKVLNAWNVLECRGIESTQCCWSMILGVAPGNILENDLISKSNFLLDSSFAIWPQSCGAGRQKQIETVSPQGLQSHIK